MSNVLQISDTDLSQLILEASNSERQRMHRNIHKNYGDPCQRLLNAIGPDSYIHPHRHSLDPKPETLVAIRGSFGLVVFNDIGDVTNIIRFGDGHLNGEGVGENILVEISADTWHTVIALKPESVLLEIKAGPFYCYAAKELAPWAPSENSYEGKLYFEKLQRLALLKNL
jgi:cupin fold WbuC family metalloprotein